MRCFGAETSVCCCKVSNSMRGKKYKSTLQFILAKSRVLEASYCFYLNVYLSEKLCFILSLF